MSNGVASGTIVIPAGVSSGPVWDAAYDLHDYCWYMSGANVQVKHDNENPTGFLVLIGSTSIRPVNANEVTEDLVGYDGFIIKSDAYEVVIAGGIDQGTYNGVHHFAEKFWGIHWFSVEDDLPTCPTQSTITVSDSLDLTIKPDCAWRQQYWSFQQNYPEYQYYTTALAQKIGLNRDAWWRFNRLNGINAEMHHCFTEAVPHATYYGNHPEYFAYLDYTYDSYGDMIPINGQIYPWSAGWYPTSAVNEVNHQRCISNADVRDLFIDWTRSRFAADSTLRYSSLSQNDGPWWCECANCEAYGDWRSKRMCNFANAISDANEAYYPDRGYAFLAYQHTLNPPTNVTLNSNIVPVIAPLWQCRLHTLWANCPDKPYMRSVYQGWDAVSSNVAWYPYISDGPFNFPGVCAMAYEMRYARDYGDIIGGLRENQFRPAVNWQMLNWMETQLLWDMDQDEVDLRREFIEGYYGTAAADAIEDVYESIEASAIATDDGRAWPDDQGDGLHGLDPGSVMKPFIRACISDVNSALVTATSMSDPQKYRVIRDMEELKRVAYPALHEPFDYSVGSYLGPTGGWVTQANNNPYQVVSTGAIAPGVHLQASPTAAYQTVSGNLYDWIKLPLNNPPVGSAWGEVANLFWDYGTFYITFLAKEEGCILLKSSEGQTVEVDNTVAGTDSYRTVLTCYDGSAYTSQQMSSLAGTQYNLYAIRIVNRDGADEVTVLRNPNLISPDFDTSSSTRAQISTSNITSAYYSELGLWGGGQYTGFWLPSEWIGGFDEIRVADTWSVAAPIEFYEGFETNNFTAAGWTNSGCDIQPDHLQIRGDVCCQV